MSTRMNDAADLALAGHEVVSRERWLERRRELLEKEKELTRLRDQVSEERRRLPWVKITKRYEFDTRDGRKTLADLFDGRSQLIVQHFMFGPEWEEGCVGCSFGADHIDGAWQHLKHHDVTYVAVARAPIAKLGAYWKRMGWQFNVASSLSSDFNFDFNVSFTKEALASGKVFYNFELIDAPIEELPGASVFYKDASGAIFHTYSRFARGGEEVLSAYMLLDITPKGRNENGPNHSLTDWVRHHDKYDAGGHVAPTGQYVAEKKNDGCGCEG